VVDRVISATDLDRVVLQIIQHGRDRCGSGFGKYPLGVLAAVKLLMPLCDSEIVAARLKEFEERLAR
jgi:hypothetical protein